MQRRFAEGAFDFTSARRRGHGEAARSQKHWRQPSGTGLMPNLSIRVFLSVLPLAILTSPPCF
jgi:hypothetical protein